MSKKSNEKADKKSDKKTKAGVADQALQTLTEDLQRVQAEFINYKNRVESEKASLSVASRARTIADLLPIIDDLERALAYIPEDLAENKWAQGVQRVYARLEKQLGKLKVEKIDAAGRPFDPAFHEAVQVDGEGDTQTVAEVLQNGYVMEDQVLRHAVVRVSNS